MYFIYFISLEGGICIGDKLKEKKMHLDLDFTLSLELYWREERISCKKYFLKCC